MTDSKARLHCCGAHHGDHEHPAGVIMSNKTSEVPIECYGTGENISSVILLIPSPIYPYLDTETRLLADALARGANVTVLVPDITISSKRRHGEDGKVNLTRSVLLLKETLIKEMNVEFLGLLETTETDSTDSDDASYADVKCCVKLFAMGSATTSTTHTLFLAQSSDDETVDPDSIETQDGIMVRQVTIKTPHASRVLTSKDNEGYAETMKTMLYFFKKHLHDWS